MKRSFQLILPLLALLLLAVFAVGCATSADAIAVSESDRYQSIYVRGQELNLAGGVLKVTVGDKLEELPLDSEEITVTGYDKDKLGKQTLTLTYGGASTEITVTVVEEVTVSGILTDYLVGDEFDKTKGNVKITDRNGMSRTLLLTDAAISIEGFDSSVARQGAEVKLVYTNGDKRCEGSFSVNIYAVEDVEIRRPNKVSYGSHYTGEADVTGGRLILIGNGGNIRREIPITQDMVSGFSISAVTPENSPLGQKLTVTYKNFSCTYDIELVYTDVSAFRDSAAAFSEEVDWNGEKEPEIEKELGELALRLMSLYTDMSAADRALLEEDAVFNVARAAMVYGFDLWGENIRLFKGVFAIEYGDTVLYLESYEKTKASLALFDDEDSPLYTVAPLLLELIEMYGDRVIYENDTERICFNSYPVMDSYALTVMEAILEHTVTLYDLLASVPDNWTAADLSNNEENILRAIVGVLREGYGEAFPGMYYLVSNWRTNSDIFDIFYNYLYLEGDTNTMEALAAHGLPKKLHELYSYIFNALIAMDDLGNIRYTDTTVLIYNYRMALACAEAIKSHENTVENYLYFALPVNGLIGAGGQEKIDFELLLTYIRTVPGGYYDISDGLLGLPEYEAILRSYTDLLHYTAVTEDYENTEEYANGIKILFDSFAVLSPMQQYNFLASLNSLYIYGIPSLAFDDSAEDAAYTSIFSVIINEFMRAQFSDAHAETYNNLILAIEVYANRFNYPEWESDFTERMDKVTAALSQMTGSDEENFTHYLGAAYGKYVAIREGIGKTAELGTWEAKMDDLLTALSDLHTAHYLLTAGGVHNYNYFLASFERASLLAEDILENAPAEVVSAYFHEALFKAYDATEDSTAVYWSCDYTLNYYRNAYIENLVFFGDTELNLYDVYVEKQLGSFLASYYSIVSAFVNRTEGEAVVFDKAEMLAVLDAFRLLDSDTKAVFEVLEGDTELYYAALAQFLTDAFSEKAAAVAVMLFNLERNFYTYEVTESDITLTAIQELLARLAPAYGALEGEDKTSFAPLEDIYAYYVEKCEQLLA